MAINLKLHYSFNQVFSSYEERYVGNSIIFEGCLKPHNQEAKDAQVIRFISGGRRYLDYELERDGAYVKGRIRYYAYRPFFTRQDWAKVRLLKSKGVKQVDIAHYFGISEAAVSRIVNRKGAYAE
ncbi:hypothetical protein JNO63_07065 [Anaerococcus sp. mt242]|uniref:hypothetical protein n=1 Tax=Anaerococcus sp. mt242 TaxID=2661917 RepID=UPI001933F195|nr:hypothetical protein [Anaerococcus sp. mt242]MBM0046850.1 hypothetical protein [Anaerococcus sp. mt242]